MLPFPSPIEPTVASDLLSTTTPQSSVLMERRNLRKSSSEEESLSLVSSGSKSCASSLTIDGSWFKEIRAHKLRIVVFVSRFHETKLKVARRIEALEGDPELWLLGFAIIGQPTLR